MGTTKARQGCIIVIDSLYQEEVGRAAECEQDDI
jgi:hypothetical protein